MLALTLKAELAGVTNLAPTDTEQEPFFYTFKVQCTSCRETHPNWVSISRFEQNELSGSRGNANFVWRCKNCKREHSASILEAPRAYVHDGKGEQTIIKLDCRGLEFVDFKPDGHWQVEGQESSTKWNKVDLSEGGEWFEYDEKTSEEVSIQDLKWNIKRA